MVKLSLFSPKPGTKINLSDFDPDFHEKYTKEGAKAEVENLHREIDELQERLYAERKQALLIVLQGMDTAGKDGLIKKVFEPVNPQGISISGFKAPTSYELAHDFLWRVHQCVPEKGYIGIFNRSHYEDVLVVRVDNLVPKDVWQKRYAHINEFERLLTDNGTRILKFFLHISKDEQKERLQARLDDPAKHWKFSTGDLPVREKWDAYMEAYADALTKCNTEYAPWHIIPANRKWYRDLFATRIIHHTLKDMNPQFPPAEPGLDKVVIPD
jgi:PPK2 family polyphosphate:nucleotide phosphotransferase